MMGLNFEDDSLDSDYLSAYEDFLIQCSVNEEIISKISKDTNISKDMVFDILLFNVDKIKKHPSYIKR